MSEKIINATVDQNIDIPDGWHVKRILSTSIWGKPTSVLITDDQPLIPDPAQAEGDCYIEGPKGSLHIICGEPNGNMLCSFGPEHEGRHSWEPDLDGFPAAPAEYHPEYYQTENGLDPWSVIKAFQLDYWRGSMVAYLLRMGDKPGDSELEDMRKVYTFAAERLRQLENEAYPVRHIVGSEDEQIHRGPTDLG